MPVLQNIRHEAFCQHIVQGAKFGQGHGLAYIKAGYNSTPAAADVAACRLLKNHKIQERIAELVTPAAAKRRVDVSAIALIDKSEALIERGLATDQLNAVGKGIELQGKLGGALIERVEVGGAGAFSNLHTFDDVALHVLETEGSVDQALMPSRRLARCDCQGRIRTGQAHSVGLNLASPRNRLNHLAAADYIHLNGR